MKNLIDTIKNIWRIAGLEGGTPKYLGAIEDGSDRGFDLAVRVGGLADDALSQALHINGDVGKLGHKAS